MPDVCKTMPSPVGTLTLVASSKGLAAILWENDKPARVPLEPLLDDDGHPILLAAEGQLREYFAGSRTAFDLPLDFRGTAFQKLVWAELLNIPFGETRSYAEIARTIGRPTAFRAVGAANGRNPISIIAPCHRVVGHNGSLTGFAGGLEAKLHLLNLERDARLPATGRSRTAAQPDFPGLD
jgi:methylated-DNA-[protein]-cysteine S-methyltransferase